MSTSNWLTTIIDWDTCKLQYEVLGDSLERVAEVHGIPLQSLQRIAEEEGWKKLDPSTSQSEITDYLVEVKRSIQVKLDLAKLYREAQLFPRITDLEDRIIDRAETIIANLDTTDVRAANALRALAQTLHAIADRGNKYTEDDALLSSEDKTYTIEVVAPPERDETLPMQVIK